jgi:hypothetical protein
MPILVMFLSVLAAASVAVALTAIGVARGAERDLDELVEEHNALIGEYNALIDDEFHSRVKLEHAVDRIVEARVELSWRQLRDAVAEFVDEHGEDGLNEVVIIEIAAELGVSMDTAFAFADVVLQ